MIIDRRQFVGAVGAAGAVSTLCKAQAASPAVAIEQVDYADVTLADGPARQQAARTLDTLLAMDEDALLKPFRKAAGQPAPGEGLGGWYDASADFDPPKDMHGFIPGHSFGQYVSALSRGYAVTGDARAKAKVQRLVAGFEPTLTPHFYEGYPLPAYTYDKTAMGLIDAYRYTGDARARALLPKALDAVTPYLPGRALDRQVVEKQPHKNPAFGWDETYTLPENLYIAAEIGAGERFRATARQYLLNDAYFYPLAQGRNVLPGRHAYSHMNALASAMKAYLVDGDPRHLAAARNGFGMIVQQSFATGGWGPNEAFVVPGSGGLGESLGRTHASFEAPCGTYGHFKVARYLLRATGDSRYGDTMERLYYNAALGLLPLRKDGVAFYYADYNDVGSKTYFDYTCPCCSGSIGQLTADYGVSAYFRDARGLFVNLYTPSQAVWRAHGEPALTLVQSGGYPLTSEVSMRVAVPRPVVMALRLRIPAWAGPNTRISVNGQAIDGVTPGRFAVIHREWRDGDRIALQIDMPLRAEPVDAQHPTRVALMAGPLALFSVGGRFSPYRAAELASVRQVAPGASEWRLDAGPDTQTFTTWTSLNSEPARLYQILAS
jgi:uncharacterized protein